MESTAASQTFRNVTIPGDDSCLFWAVTFAYLFPVQYDSASFKERFENLFANKDHSEMTEIRELFQRYRRHLNTADIADNETLKWLVTTNLRNRVVTKMLVSRKEFQDCITLSDILQSKNSGFITEGIFEKRFCTEFKREIDECLINVNSSALRTFKGSAMQVILSELDKVDQRKVKRFVFETYLDCMRDRKAWGGLHEIKALSRLLHCNIYVISEGKQHHFNCDESRDEIHLLHKYKARYEFFQVTGQALIEVMRKDKKKEAKNYLHVGIDDVNYKDDDGWTPLHFAAQFDSVEIIQALLAQGADIHAKNCIHQTPLDVALYFEKKNAARFLKEQFRQTGSRVQSKIQGHSGNKRTNETAQVLCSQGGSQIQENAVGTAANEVKARLKEFVGYFVKEFESKLHICHMIMEEEMHTAAKNSDTFEYKMGMGILGCEGAAVGCLPGPPGFGAAAGKEAGKLLGSKVGKAHHEKKVVKFSELVHYSQKEKADFRRILVEAAIDIFQSFEMQFMRVTSEFGPKQAMHDFARDATNRAVNYLKNNEVASISEAVILGESKIQTVLGVPIPSAIKSPGFQVLYRYQSSEVKWKTASLYQKVGLVVSDGESVNFYEKKDGTSMPRKYGYRRLLLKEDWDELKAKYVSDKESKDGNIQFTGYLYTLSPNCLAECSRSLLYLVMKDDENIIEERIKEMLAEVRNDVLEELNVLKEHRLQLHEEDRKTLDIIEESLKSLKTEEYSSKLIQHFEDTFQELARPVLKGQAQGREQNICLAMDEIGFNVNDSVEQLYFNMDDPEEPIWFNVNDPGALFTGRHDKIEELHDTILMSGRGAFHQKLTWICGFAGIGKSELVRKYVGDYHKDKNVIWINAKKYETIAESFIDLARDRLSIPTEYPNGKEKKIELIVKDVYRYLSRGESLFVFDDVKGDGDLHKFLKLYDLMPNKPYILITSRYREWEPGRPVVELEELKVEDALELVRKGLGISEDDMSENEKILCLVKELQCFPLAIQQAIAYINGQRANKFSVSKYLEMYDEKTRDLLEFRGFRGRFNSYEKTTYTTWKIATDIISSDEKDGELALRILYFMAYIGPENVDRKIFQDLLRADEEKVIPAVQLLVKYSMINYWGKERKQDILSIHTLVQELMRLELRSREREVEILRELLQLMKTNLKTEGFHHAVSAWEHAVAYEELIKDLSDVPQMIVCELNNSLKSQKAYVFGKQVSLLLEEVLGPDHLDALSTRNSLAVALSRLGNFDEALSVFLQVFRKRKRLLGDNNPDTLTTMNHIASVHKNQGDYRKALKVYQEVLDGRKQAIGPDHPHTLLTMKGIAEVFLHQDDCEEALKFYQEVLGKQEKIHDHDNPDIFATKNDIAFVLQKEGRYEEALEIYQNVLSKRKESFGLEHPDTLTTVKGMAEIFVHQENYRGALEYCKQLLSAKMPLGNNLLFTDAMRILQNLLKICIENEKPKKANDVLVYMVEACDQRFKSELLCCLGKPDEILKEGLNSMLRPEILTVHCLQTHVDDGIQYIDSLTILHNDDHDRRQLVYQEINKIFKGVNITSRHSKKPQHEEIVFKDFDDLFFKDEKYKESMENCKELLHQFSQLYNCFEKMCQKDGDAMKDS